MHAANPIRAYPLTAFTILACAIGWMFHVAQALGAGITGDNMPLGPLVAAAIVAGSSGSAGAVVAPILVMVAAVLVNHVWGAPLPTSTQLAGWTGLGGAFVLFLIAVGVGEEAGWTGFAAPLLLGRHGFLPAWLILATMRVLWHLPLMLRGDLTWTLGVGGNIAFQLVLLWLFQRSGQRWFPAAVWHAVLNTVFFRMVQGPDQVRLGLLMTAGYWLVALFVLLADRGSLAGAPSRPAITGLHRRGSAA
jgi:membrane protease YdiL (CAAX protease family)